MSADSGAAVPLGLRWLATGEAAFLALEGAIAAARDSIELQTYILRDGPVARRIHAALVAARQRGVRVRVLVDALGSFSLPAHFRAGLSAAGVEYRVFNPLHLRRFLHRNHRKSLSCDRRIAIIGGFNIADEYAGDGVERGWRDLGLEIRGPLAAAVTHAFEELWALADFHPRRFARLRRATQRRRVSTPQGELLLGGAGRGANPLKAALLRDIGRAQQIRIVSPYFLPTLRLRRKLMQVVRRGGRVQLLLPGRSDVPLAQRAARSLYRRLLRAGIEIHEYQPQILHAKLLIIDRAVYAGSANFNTRSLHIDYELMLRSQDPALVEQAEALFAQDLAHARRIDPADWRGRRGLWEGLQQRLAYLLMARIDPLVAGWLWRWPRKNRG